MLYVCDCSDKLIINFAWQHKTYYHANWYTVVYFNLIINFNELLLHSVGAALHE